MGDARSSVSPLNDGSQLPDSSKALQEANRALAPTNNATGKGLLAILKTAARHLPLVFGVYALGYFNFSFAWIIGIIGVSAATEQWRKEKMYRMSAARASSLYSDKEVILARVADLPSWVFFPDFDRAEWINKILKQIWPNVGHYVRNIILESVQPGIREALKAYKLGGFKMDKISLGTIPFRVGGVKVYDKNVSRNEIVMDLDVCYAGDCDIRFSVKGIKGGIKDFQVAGMLRVVMKPLIPQIPLVGGIQVFFLNSPSVDFNLIGVADVLDMPGLNGVLRRVIVDQIGAFLVLPNKICITLSDTVSPTSIKIPEPAGVLRIRVIEAKQLMKMDVGVLGMGKSDPYAIISVGSQEFRTKTINNTVNPKWDFYCECLVSERQSQQCLFQLFDRDEGSRDDDPLGKNSCRLKTVPQHDCQNNYSTTTTQSNNKKMSNRNAKKFISKAKVESLRAQNLFIQVWDYDAGFPGIQNDDYLGRATVDIYSVAKAGKKDMWVTLEDVKSGLVHLELTWFNLATDAAMLKMHVSETQSLGLSSSLLIVYIDSATSLPSARTSSKPDPYVVVTVGNRSEQTSPRSRTTDPAWEQAITFLVCNPESDDLSLKVMDQKTGGELGERKITLVSLLTLPGMELSQPLTLKNSGPDSKLIVSIRLKVMVPGQPMEEGSQDTSSVSDDVFQPPKTPSREPTPAHSSASSPTAELETNNQRNSSAKLDKIPSLDQAIGSTMGPIFSAAKINLDREASIRRRNKGGLPPGVVSQIQLTLRYSSQRQRLIVVVHKVCQLPKGEGPDLPDPYVKLYLLPDRSHASKRKTEIVKDSVNPVFDETFEYSVAPLDLPARDLEISIVNRKGRFARSPIMCSVSIPLSQHDLSQAMTQWFDLKPSSE